MDQKWVNLPKPKYFQKTIDKPSSYHSCLSTFQKSKSDINLSMKYWRLKNTEIDREPFLAVITSEPDSSQVCSFCRMLKDHKNFRFITIPDKAKDLIFLKSPKNLAFSFFLTIFDIIFFKKTLLSHLT